MSERIACIGIGVIMAGIFGWVTYRGFKTGRMWEKNNYFARRSSEPFFFWIAAILNLTMCGVGLWVVQMGLSGVHR